MKEVATKYYYKIEEDSLLKIWRAFAIDSIENGIFYANNSVNKFDSFGILKTREESRFVFNGYNSKKWLVKSFESEDWQRF